MGHIYIRSFVESSPSRAAHWRRAINDEWWSVLHSRSGKPPHGPLTTCHRKNGENTKAWYLIADGNSNPNKWSHSWVISKSIISMEKTIFHNDNGEKMPLSLEREKACLERMKKGNNADSNSSK